ncbi:hypothetical protein [Paenibacillus ferrarius]|uniref:hypothetical protein n=1 Tax=Paenibacillus ferrarius TaxID=1469647 RepID=UPI00117CE7C1|nr:hypothetical protein [Paenibacillus ferrarius]
MSKRNEMRISGECGELQLDAAMCASSAVERVRRVAARCCDVCECGGLRLSAALCASAAGCNDSATTCSGVQRLPTTCFSESLR